MNNLYEHLKSEEENQNLHWYLSTTEICTHTFLATERLYFYKNNKLSKGFKFLSGIFSHFKGLL